MSKVVGWMVLGVFLWCGTAWGYSYSQDFSTTSGNPNGVWSYGYLANSGAGPFVAHNHTMPAGVGLTLWETDGNADAFGNINKATSGAEDHPDWPSPGGCGMSWDTDMTCMMTPVDPSRWSAAVFTAPQAGLWNVAIDFENRVMVGNLSNVYVKVNGVDVLLDQIDGFPGSELGAPVVAPVLTDGWDSSYAGVLNLAQGDTVTFGVYSLSWSNFNHVAVEADITQVPEPVTLGLLAIGGLLLRRRR